MAKKLCLRCDVRQAESSLKPRQRILGWLLKRI
jgi:hypothetical protein